MFIEIRTLIILDLIGEKFLLELGLVRVLDLSASTNLCSYCKNPNIHFDSFPCFAYPH